MGFMYLHLRTADQGREIRATVMSHGAPTVSSLGGPNSRPSHGPFAVFQIDGFDGLENVDEKLLMQELFRRYTTKELLQQLQLNMTTRELLELLSDRLTDRH
jgi:hypothetical protein